MTAEQKVKQVYPMAFCYRMRKFEFYIIEYEGALGDIGKGEGTRGAWAEAWRNIQKQQATSQEFDGRSPTSPSDDRS